MAKLPINRPSGRYVICSSFFVYWLALCSSDCQFIKTASTGLSIPPLHGKMSYGMWTEKPGNVIVEWGGGTYNAWMTGQRKQGPLKGL